MLLVETVRKTGLDEAIWAALSPLRKPRAVHDPGRSAGCGGEALESQAYDFSTFARHFTSANTYEQVSETHGL